MVYMAYLYRYLEKKKPLTTGKQATRHYLMTKLSNIPITRHKTQLYM